LYIIHKHTSYFEYFIASKFGTKLNWKKCVSQIYGYYLKYSPMAVSLESIEIEIPFWWDLTSNHFINHYLNIMDWSGLLSKKNFQALSIDFIFKLKGGWSELMRIWLVIFLFFYKKLICSRNRSLFILKRHRTDNQLQLIQRYFHLLLILR